MGFSRYECWSVIPFPPPGDLPNPGIEPRSPALQADSLPSETPGKPYSSGYELVSHCGFNLHFHDGYSDVKHLSEAYGPFIYLLWGNTYSSPLPTLKLFVLLLLRCRGSLYILNIKLLSDRWFANNFFPFCRLCLHFLSFFLFYIYLAVPGLSYDMWELVFCLGIKPGPLVLGVWSLNHCTTNITLLFHFGNIFSFNENFTYISSYVT